MHQYVDKLIAPRYDAFQSAAIDEFALMSACAIACMYRKCWEHHAPLLLIARAKPIIYTINLGIVVAYLVF